MRNKPMKQNHKKVISLSLGLSAVLLSPFAQAGCERSDVEFYLKQGFSPEQITTICSSAPETAKQAKPQPQSVPAPAVKPAAPVVTEQPEVPAAAVVKSAPVNSTEQKLQSLMSGKKVALTDDVLNFVQKTCVSYEYDAYFPPTQVICPKIEYTVQRKGLNVLKAESVFLEGNQVRVEGKVSKVVLESFEDKDLDEQKIIKAALSADEGAANIKSKNKAAAKELATVLNEITK